MKHNQRRNFIARNDGAMKHAKCCRKGALLTVKEFDFQVGMYVDPDNYLMNTGVSKGAKKYTHTRLRRFLRDDNKKIEKSAELD